jgi:hypothetical protein
MSARDFVVFAEPTIAAEVTEPGEAAFDDPRQSSDLEGALPAFYDSQFPSLVTQQLTGKLAALMTGIRNHCVDFGETAEPNRLTSNRLHGDRTCRPLLPASSDRKSKGMDQDVAFPAFDTPIAIKAASVPTLCGSHR